MNKDYDRVGIMGHQTARPVLDPRKSARPNNTLPKVGTGKHMNRVMTDQLTIEELRDQFEKVESKFIQRAKHLSFSTEEVRVGAINKRFDAWVKCAKTNNILREG